MQIFATRVWSFDPTSWPVITFGLKGNRDKLLKESRPGDRIVFIGTQGEPTSEAMRGKLLGMAEIGRRAVKTLDVISPERRNPRDFDEQGRFKWPSGILMIKAWRFEPQPRLLDVLAAQLPYHATPQAVLLSLDDASAVLGLKIVEVDLPISETLTKAKQLDAALNGRPTFGPKPTSWNGESGRDINRTAFTYAFRFGQSEIWKIGHTIDISERIKQVNLHIPAEIVPHQWRPIYQQEWSDESEAHTMEQKVLELLKAWRTVGERVKCSELDILSAWLSAIGG
jgi:hypothetical protein